MSVWTSIFLSVVLTSATVYAESTFATCGDENSDDVAAVINATVDRLMELRQPTWGWANTPEAVLGLQLSTQELFFGRDKAVKRMKEEITADLPSMSVGKLALYVTALQSCCENPFSIDGNNLVRKLDWKTRMQFYYDGSRQTDPRDGYYQFGLALGALCVNHRHSRTYVLKKLLQRQNIDGSFGDGHSVDDSAQILLALECITRESRPAYVRCKVRRAIERLVTFLLSKVNLIGQNVWIGNKYSSPSSALALMEADEDSPEAWRCDDVMGSLTTNPQASDPEGALSQRLPSLKGISYLDLRDRDWQCDPPVPIPPGYEPTCDPTDQTTCNPISPTDPNPAIIDVRLTIFTDPPSSVGTVPEADVISSVSEGSTLLVAMNKAKDEGKITFETRTTSWGEMVTSMEGVTANEDAHEYWALINGATGELLPQGISSYIPTSNEQIVYRLKTW